MKVGRNEPCPCGSGKKYKRCCLEKDRMEPAVAPSASEAFDAEEQAEADEWDEERLSGEVAPEDREGPQPVPENSPSWPSRTYPRPDDYLPELPPERQEVIKTWWNTTTPLYRKRDADALIRRVEVALQEIPNDFVHLELHHEFLFELGAELGRRGRMPEYIALLQRLRQKQPQMYSFCYGAYDSDIIAELVVTGQVDQIPSYLDFFRQYPDAEPDYCHQTCHLLAWRGLAEPLHLLCEIVATPMVTSSEAWRRVVRRVRGYANRSTQSGAEARALHNASRILSRRQILNRATYHD